MGVGRDSAMKTAILEDGRSVVPESRPGTGLVQQGEGVYLAGSGDMLGVNENDADALGDPAKRASSMSHFVDALAYGVIVSRTWNPTKPQILRANRARTER